jgi:hypothetical protein
MAGIPAPRSWATWLVLGLLSIVALVFALVLTTGLSIADEAGQPLDVPPVAITPDPARPAPTPTATQSGDNPTIVDPAPPITVEIDDHGGHGSDDPPGDDSGGGGSNSGSGRGDDG